MSYIGKEPVVGNFQVCDAISVVNGQAAYTMQVNSTNVEPENANHMLVSLNGILQKPGSSFTISGATITFASNLATGDVIDFIILLGDTLNVGTPSDDSVGAAQIKNDLISGLTELSTAPADTDEFLVSDAGTLKRVDASLVGGGGITNAQEFLLTSNKSGTNSTDDFITSNISENATASYGAIGSNVSQSSGVFSFSATGIYLVTFEITGATSSTDDFDASIDITTDNSTFENRARKWFNPRTSEPDKFQGTIQTIVDVSNTTNVKIKFNIGPTNPPSSNVTFYGSSDEIMTGFRFIRLGDT